MKDIIEINAAALATSSLIRTKTPSASAAHSRISLILFHSGTKHEDLVRLNRLGVCVPPQSIIHLQKKLNEQLEAKVKFWKKAVKDNKMVASLCDDVIQNQVAKKD